MKKNNPEGKISIEISKNDKVKLTKKIVIEISKNDKKLLELVKIAKEIVLKEDADLFEELAKH
tara:strand:- start:504 stop:692 length:189 start_codon:yes stop_codon:yes gene_type:complete